MAEPIGDAEGAEFREVAVVEHQNELAVVRTEALDRVAVAAREIPDVAGGEVEHFGMRLRVDRGDATAALEHIGPFRGVGVPVQFAQRTGRKLHQHAGELFGHRKFRDGRFFRPAALVVLDRLRTEREAERRQLLAAERRGRRPEARLSTLGKRLRCARRCRHDAAGGSGADHIASRQVGHRRSPRSVCASIIAAACKDVAKRTDDSSGYRKAAPSVRRYPSG